MLFGVFEIDKVKFILNLFFMKAKSVVYFVNRCILAANLLGGFLQLLQLLLKSSQDKRFVCEEADKTLNTMVQSLTPLPLLHNLQKYARHFNPKVRAKAAISISSCVSRMVTISCLTAVYMFMLFCLVASHLFS